jgi:hypothetical protein
MSEASRARWLHIHNRLEELLAKHGPPPEVLPCEPIDVDPSWGPVGSLAEQLLTPALYEWLVAIDEEMSPGIHAHLRPGPAESRGADW